MDDYIKNHPNAGNYEAVGVLSDKSLSIPVSLIEPLFVPNKFEAFIPDEDGDRVRTGTFTITDISAMGYNEEIFKANSCNQLVPKIIPELGKGSLNRVKIVFGEKPDKPPHHEFWEIIKEVEFLMNNRRYKVKRNDFDVFWTHRYYSEE